MANFIPDNIDFSVYMLETDSKQNIKSAKDYIPSIKERMRSRAHEKRTYLPWLKANDSFHFREGELTVWAGQNGHGKSLITAQIAMHLMQLGNRVCMASFEMKPAETIKVMSRMYIGTNPYTPEYQNDTGYVILDKLFDQFGQWSDNRLWIYDQTGTTNPETVLGMTRYCAKELGIKHIFIDSLMKVVGSEDDYNGQKKFVGELFSIAKDLQVHIHLIHHLKKPQNEAEIPDKHSTKGSGSITDQIDNLFLVWRNKGKEDDIRNAGKFGNKQQESDTILFCRKQRHFDGNGDGEPSIALWLHRDSGQFIGGPSDPIPLYE